MTRRSRTSARRPSAGANIVCLPELFRAQYFCQREDIKLFDLAEPIPGPSTTRLAEVAREARVVIVASLFERRAPGLYHNTAVTLGQDGSIISVYRKMHIPDDPLYYEKFYFTPGDLGFKAVDTAFGRVGTLVCWDQWYPEGARLTALQGAEVLFYPTAIGWHPAEKEEFGAAQYDAWQTIQRAHAIANGVYVAGVNRVGHENGDILGNRARRAGPGVLGRQLSRRSVRPHHRQGLARGGGDSDRRDRHGAARRHAPQLAVSSRPPHRRLRAHHAALSRSAADAWSADGDPQVSNVTLSRRNAARTRLPHARRMGAARGDVAGVAAQSRRLAGQISGDSVALCRDRAPARCARASASSRAGCEGRRAARPASSSGPHANLDSVSFHQWPTDRVWTRDSGPIFVRNTGRARSRSRTGTSMPGRSMPTGISTTRSRIAWPNCSNLPQWQPTIDLGGETATAGPRRRLDRHQRAGHSADHRRVPAERSAAAQSRREPRAA